ncbi:MAG: hypothetical protein ACYCX4_16740, partial [Bacillota bacterium]
SPYIIPGSSKHPHDLIEHKFYFKLEVFYFFPEELADPDAGVSDPKSPVNTLTSCGQTIPISLAFNSSSTRGISRRPPARRKSNEAKIRPRPNPRITGL